MTSTQTAEVKVNKWNIQEVRVAFDDLVVKFMNEKLKFKEDNSLILLKLVVYFLLNVIGVATGLYGYFVKPFESTRLLVGIGSAVYLVATGIWTLFLQYKVVQTCYRGRDQKGKQVWLRSSIKYPEGIYQIDLVAVGSGDSIGKPFQVNVGQWVDVDGNICEESAFMELENNLKSKFKFD